MRGLLKDTPAGAGGVARTAAVELHGGDAAIGVVVVLGGAVVDGACGTVVVVGASVVDGASGSVVVVVLGASFVDEPAASVVVVLSASVVVVVVSSLNAKFSGSAASSKAHGTHTAVTNPSNRWICPSAHLTGNLAGNVALPSKHGKL